MYSPGSGAINRRNVLQTAGALVLLSTLGVGNVAAARSERTGNDFGNGNGIGAFLNEQAAYKDSPVWDSGIADMTGRDSVEIVVGAMTSVELPGFPMGPFAFAPRAVEVSPGTDVTWVWPSFPIPIPHDVVSLTDGAFDSGLRFPGGAAFTRTFDDVGTYLYDCTPHGAPFPVHPHGAPEGVTVYNEFGMRGAVLVVDD